MGRITYRGEDDDEDDDVGDDDDVGEEGGSNTNVFLAPTGPESNSFTDDHIFSNKEGTVRGDELTHEPSAAPSDEGEEVVNFSEVDDDGSCSTCRSARFRREEGPSKTPERLPGRNGR